MLENNLVRDKERRKAKEKMNRLIDFRVKTKDYSRIKMDITGIIGRHQGLWCVYRRTRNIKWRIRQVWKYINRAIENF